MCYLGFFVGANIWVYILIPFVLQGKDVLWGDFHQQLVDSALISVDAYMVQFPEIKVDFGTI